MPAAHRPGQLSLFTKRVSRPPPAPEFATHCMVADVLRRFVEPEWRWTHIASGEYRTPSTAARLKRMGVMPGWSDLILLSPDGQAHCLELKRRGGRLTKEQDNFAKWCAAHGVPFAIAHSFDEALTQLKVWGAVRTNVRVSA